MRFEEKIFTFKKIREYALEHISNILLLSRLERTIFKETIFPTCERRNIEETIELYTHYTGKSKIDGMIELYNSNLGLIYCMKLDKPVLTFTENKEDQKRLKEYLKRNNFFMDEK